MATVADLIAETRSHLMSMARDEMNRVTTATDATQADIQLDFAVGSANKGSIVAIDLELMYVWQVNPTARTITVRRGYLGSTATAHAAGALVYVNPRFSDFAILRALNEELRAYSSPKVGLYQMKGVNITYSSSRAGYDLTGITDLISVYDVLAKEPGGHRGWTPLRSWRVVGGMDTADFASGRALLLYDAGYPGKAMRIVYKARFGALGNVTDVVEVVAGLPIEAQDIPPLGAAARLVAPREVKRAFSEAQPEPRAATEVPPGANRQAAAGLLALRQTRLAEENARLQALYPPLSRKAG